jgi:hypothetical protein
MKQHLEKALAQFNSREAVYEKADRYYEGRHDLAFATEKFQNTFGSLFREFALNLCPIVCDALRDKLRIARFSVDAAPAGTLDVVGETLRQFRHRNKLSLRSGEVHKDALISGDAYVIIWPDANGRAVIHPNAASAVTVAYDPSDPTRVSWAAKRWTDEVGRRRVNMMFADRTERYVSTERPAKSGFAAAGTHFNVEEMKLDSTIENPYGRVPVFHFANNAGVGRLGRSELEPAIPIQDGLNKSVLDMLVAMEFSAFRQRWAAGIEVELNDDGKPIMPFESGIQHLWVAEDPNARFGDFEAANLDQFLKVKDSFRIDIASVTGTPLHYFLPNTRGLPSGESLKRAETRFLAKVRDRHESFGDVWADAAAFAVRIETGIDVALTTQWHDPAPMTEREVLENILLKKQIGLGTAAALAEAGYGRTEIIDQMEEKNGNNY